MLVATALYPRLIFDQLWMYAIVLGLSLAILAALMGDPLGLLKLPAREKVEPAGGERLRRYQENRKRNEKMAELNRLLDRAAKDGLKSLSKSQREKMEHLSKELYH